MPARVTVYVLELVLALALALILAPVLTALLAVPLAAGWVAFVAAVGVLGFVHGRWTPVAVFRGLRLTPPQ